MKRAAHAKLSEWERIIREAVMNEFAFEAKADDFLRLFRTDRVFRNALVAYGHQLIAEEDAPCEDSS